VRTAPVVIGFVILAVLTALVVWDVPLLYDLDARISSAAARYAEEHPGWVDVMRVVTHLGDPQVVIGAGAVLALTLLVCRRPRAALSVIAVILVLGLIRYGMAALVGRERPEEQLDEVSGYAFPSGHTTTATAAALILLYLTLPVVRGVIKALMVAVALVWAGVVGVSRVALVVHWPSDVVGGFALTCVVVPPLLVWIHRLSLPPWTPPLMRGRDSRPSHSRPPLKNPVPPDRSFTDTPPLSGR